MEKTLFSILLLFFGYSILEHTRRSNKHRPLSKSSSKPSETHRNEAAIQRGKNGINLEGLNTKDLSLYPQKGGDPSKSATSKAIAAIHRAEEELAWQREALKHAHIPSLGAMIPRESVFQTDQIIPRPVRTPKEEDINYTQVLLSKRRISQKPPFNRHTFIPNIDNEREPVYFESLAYN